MCLLSQVEKEKLFLVPVSAFSDVFLCVLLDEQRWADNAPLQQQKPHKPNHAMLSWANQQQS